MPKKKNDDSADAVRGAQISPGSMVDKIVCPASGRLVVVVNPFFSHNHAGTAQLQDQQVQPCRQSRHVAICSDSMRTSFALHSSVATKDWNGR